MRLLESSSGISTLEIAVSIGISALLFLFILSIQAVSFTNQKRNQAKLEFHSRVDAIQEALSNIGDRNDPTSHNCLKNALRTSSPNDDVHINPNGTGVFGNTVASITHGGAAIVTRNGAVPTWRANHLYFGGMYFQVVAGSVPTKVELELTPGTLKQYDRYPAHFIVEGYFPSKDKTLNPPLFRREIPLTLTVDQDAPNIHGLLPIVQCSAQKTTLKTAINELRFNERMCAMNMGTFTPGANGNRCDAVAVPVAGRCGFFGACDDTPNSPLILSSSTHLDHTLYFGSSPNIFRLNKASAFRVTVHLRRLPGPDTGALLPITFSTNNPASPQTLLPKRGNSQPNRVSFQLLDSPGAELRRTFYIPYEDSRRHSPLISDSLRVEVSSSFSSGIEILRMFNGGSIEGI